MQNCVYICVNFSEKSEQTSSKGNYHLTKIKKTKSHLIANITFNHNLKKKVMDAHELYQSTIIQSNHSRQKINKDFMEGEIYRYRLSLSLSHTHTPMLQIIKWSGTL